MLGVKRSSWAAGEGQIFEGVCSGFQKLGCRARCSVKGESSPAAIRSDRSHPCGPKGFDNNQKRSVDRSTGERLLRKTIT